LETKERYYTTENDFEIKKYIFTLIMILKYTEIIQNYSLNNNTKAMKIRYINRGIYNKPKEVNNLKEYENNLENKRSRFLEELNWHIDIYRNHNDEKISIGIEKNNNQTFILSFQNEIKSEEILKKAALKKVSNLPLKYILNNKNKN
jgi:putative albumin-binding protein-like protein 1